MSVLLAPLPRLQFGLDYAGYQLFTYAAGTVTKLNTYTDSSGATPNLNPIILDANGSCACWLTPLMLYKFVLALPTDRDPPTSPVWTSDNIDSINDVLPQFDPNITVDVSIIPTTITATDVANLQVTRNASYTGGSPGFVNATVRADCYVVQGVSDYEWAMLGVMQNSSAAGQNVAVYGQGNRCVSAAGPTWGGVMEVQELVPVSNPTAGLIGLEVDNRSNGPDTNLNRVGVDVVCTRYNTATSAATTAVGFGVRVQSNRDAASTTIQTGYGFDVSTTVNVGFDASAAIQIQAAFKMASNQPIAFDQLALNQLAYDGVGLGYRVSGTLESRLNSQGSLSLYGPATTSSGGSLTIGSGTATSASTTGAIAPPANVLGYLSAYLGTTAVKIPYYPA